MSFLGFLTQKKFYINLGISVLVTILVLVIVFSFLKAYTRHGEAYVVPDLTGLTVHDLQTDESLKIFNLQVTDSVFDNSLLPGSVIMQNPSPGSKAKEGRNIYVTVVSYIPKMSIMPEIKDMTVRQAVTTLKSSGLNIRRLIYTEHFAENSVLGQYYNGDTLIAGTEILEGSDIDLQVGLGKNQKAKVPFVIGLTRDQAHDAVQMASFNYGWEHYMDTPNPLHSRVYRQYPAWNEELYPGDSLTLYFRSDLRYNFDSLRQYINPDTAVILQAPDGLGADSTELEEE
jgi:eukaryotic-like serine/threonine-protein kinase